MKSVGSLYLIAYSPDDLKSQLKEMLKKQRLKGRSVYLALTDDEIMLRPLVVEQGVNSDKMAMYVAKQAAQVLPLPLSDIVVDHQIGSKSKRGVFICTSRKKLDQYYRILMSHHLDPLQIIPYSLLVTNYFLSEQKIGDKQHVLLDCFKPSGALVAVYTQHYCVVVRLVDHDSFDQLKSEIDSTVMSACAQSAVKKCDSLYIYGEDEHKEALMTVYKKTYANVMVRPRINLTEAFNVKAPIYPLHLSRNEVLSSARIWQLSCALLVVLFAVVVAGVTLGMQINGQKQQIAQIEKQIKALK